MTSPTIVWLRRDLRLHDQAAFIAAAASGSPVIPVYVLDDETPKHRRMGAASRWWLHHSLERLDAQLQAMGSRLILRRGKCDAALAAIRRETGARVVHALHHYEPWWRLAERAVGKALDLRLHHGNFLLPPGTVTTGAGQPYKIYTPFWRASLQQLPPPPPQPAPETLPAPEFWPASDTLADWQLLPKTPDWAEGMRDTWTPGEAGAAQRIEAFIGRARRYDEQRNLPSCPGTSMLSPHLHFGEISPATVWHAVADAGGSVDVFLSELGWRDYAQNLILQCPDYATRNGRAAFDALPWRDAPEELAAWQQGRTGYPIVDAGMRQLWHTGWMHNRVRMIAASFLIKHLLIDWRAGEQWFWDTLVDADYGANATNWQWVAGSGLDANMFVRIMAPLSQSAKFDAAAYIREWVPQLRHLDDADIHDPQRPPRGYPAKIVDHGQARARALAAHGAMKAQA
ncbi:MULTISPECIES: deoxyribodipyrimidine photo-lyase [unclassified Novosphingobium]|uniref:cryptochrome/photolyase family protein n=1 Tax=unclassified Novosphingobium TaxID=2644732 RepID=UPI0014949EA9|nr:MULTISPECIES: deoxyribodipyrimidine photo-lyase [unclassified Novosphingobium]MBB3357777.1 deoxyribodipyrimidine photo-lyase [Novosphingobium sp. BK256]MBB3373559.1 deoxyribodipyrimidine photo-lyase [Novosphingobium sp. BK280]MBB3377971.1 deoxyribodipyrimidine photo-lyase [Novosphingobium sp. BK258]MBB3420244.1 deoxyribodipyrimidine photo-lyase [Novosphingobium sp. BK267]MBB3447434.1 deoxyribodipyrimidine photo-lyase [Novosphingobium sp. BK352]